MIKSKHKSQNRFLKNPSMPTGSDFADPSPARSDRLGFKSVGMLRAGDGTQPSNNGYLLGFFKKLVLILKELQ
jgi:hypothetical protein